MRTPPVLSDPDLYAETVEQNNRRLVCVDAFMIEARDTARLIAWLQRALAWRRAEGKRREKAGG